MTAMFSSAVNMMMLSLEAQQAVQLRMVRLGAGGMSAADEAVLMVREKIEAFGRATGSAMSGASFDSMVCDYRSVVQANIERLKTTD